MASNKNVVVLTPNGRRQNVKVTPNTTILQVLEEVCLKQGLKPDEYDIKHHNHILDVSSMIRFSGLPNNAQLEMCAIQKIREESPVTLGLQLENGTRLTGNFFPNDNLWNILMKLCPEHVKPEKNPVVIYMRQEIYGLQSLQNTSLKSLGLTGGRAMVRLIHRKPEELRTQANVSTPLPSKPPEERPYIRKLQKIEEPEQIKKDISEPVTFKRDSVSPTSPTTKKNNFVTDFIQKEKSRKSSDPQKTKNNSSNPVHMEVDPATIVTDIEQKLVREITSEDFAFLGERNALAFSLDMARTVPHDDLPDEFFELTLKDARKIFADLKQKRVELEENPLQTSALRSLEQDKKILRHLSQYKKTVIRIQFPDRTVLQGTFKPLETVEVVKTFVKEYLGDPTKAFHLYTTPPKCILDPNNTLLDLDCVPGAVVHFALDTPVTEDYKYLKPNLFTKFTSHSLASIAAARSRVNEVKPVKPEEPVEDMEVTVEEIRRLSPDLDVNVGASTSGVGRSYTAPPKSNGTQEKVPKWFKPNK